MISEFSKTEIISNVWFIHSLVFSHRGWSGRNQSPVMEPIWLLAHCALGKFLGVVCHCFPPPLEVPTFATTCLCVHSNVRDPSSERWNCGRERCPVVILPKFRLPHKFKDLLHAANLRHGTDGFTSPRKEGVLRIFSMRGTKSKMCFSVPVSFSLWTNIILIYKSFQILIHDIH